MREILFRGKTLTGKWVEGAYYKQEEFYGDKEDAHIIITSKETLDNDFALESHIVIPETVGQFTGLTDKNGKRIFEGDVVKFTDSPFGFSYTGVVCFNEVSFCIKYEYWKKEEFHRIGQTDEWQNMGASGTVTYEHEVLGNMHDNPELLGDK